MLNKRILKDISTERDFQDRRWGANQGLDYATWMTVLGEEFGEACQALLKMRQVEKLSPGMESKHHVGLNALRAELIQVAAVAVEIIEQIDKEAEREQIAQT